MIDLSERIRWRALKHDLPGDYYAEKMEANLREDIILKMPSTWSPILCFSRSASRYTILCNYGIIASSEGRITCAPYCSLTGLSFDRSVARSQQYRVFLDGQGHWVDLPIWPHFHSFANIILMCIRISSKKCN